MKSRGHATDSSGIVTANANTSSPTPPSLYQLLKNADLLEYNDKLRSVLKLRHAGDVEYTEEKDLTNIGMSRPEQKRLRREYLKLYPQSSLVVRLRKVFGRTDGRQSDQGASTSEDGLSDDQQHIISADSIELCRELGRGEFGICFQGTWTLPHGDSIQVAIKRVPPERLKSNPTSFLQEAAVMTKMRHDNVIRMYGIVLDTKSVMLVSELAPYGSLLECLQKPAWDEPFAVDKLCEFARQIACGMSYLSSQRLIHRDLAARNVLVSTLTKVKISDFGLSRSLGISDEYYRSDFSPTMKLPIAWCAPECINILRFTSASDVYAFGVTLYEIFSYGKMPWHGYTGSQILHTIDTQRKTLECPDACPSQFYELMKRCWAHDVDKRPKFEEIEQLIPELMPQLLISATDCHKKESGQLQFNKGDTIILLDKCRDVTPGGSNFWHGALRNGQTGLFKPEETVAYLGAENPSSTKLIPLANGQSKVIAKDRKSMKVTDKEKKKLLISEPQGDLRHTCHVGLDGKVFGLIHVNKNDLSKALTPLIGLSDPATLSIATTAPSSTPAMSSIASSLSPAARSTTASSTGSTCSSLNQQQRSSKRQINSNSGSSCTSPTLASVRELGQKNVDTIIQNGYDIPQRMELPPRNDIPQRMPKSYQVAPPALPPKPAARIKPQRSLATDSIHNVFPKTPSLAHRTQSLPKHTDNNSSILSSSISSNELTRPKSITAESGFYFDSKGTTEPADNMSRSFHDSSQLLDEVLTTLQRDISDFSLSTINDFSDTRPLIDPRKQKEKDQEQIVNDEIHVRPLTQNENDRLTKRISDGHKKAARSLAKEFQQFKRLSSTDKPTKAEVDTCEGNYVSKIGSGNEEWSSEAQAAYKLLIECGDFLKTTSPVQSHADRMSKSPNACVSSSTDTDSTVRNLAPPLPPKKIQYINNTLVGNEDLNDEMEKVEIVDQRQSLSSYENTKSEFDKPPQIPPKAKARQNLPRQDESIGRTSQNGRFAPSVQKTALFSSFPKDEVVKF